MATFERSPLGQQNRSLFMRVDATVYVEGGDEYQGRVESYDVLFWKKMFYLFKPTMRVRLLPRGRKAVLLELARNVANDNIDNVFIAMDADYDILTGVTVSDRRVFYTYGYSWENDVWQRECVFRTFFNVSPMDERDVDILPELLTLLESFDSGVSRLTLVDFLAVKSGFSAIDRDKPEIIIVSGKYGSMPKLNKTQIDNAIKRACKAKRDMNLIVRSGLTSPIEIPRFCVGKLVSAFATRILYFLLKKYTNRKTMNNQQTCSLAIHSFSEYINEDRESMMYKYYADQFSRV